MDKRLTLMTAVLLLTGALSAGAQTGGTLQGTVFDDQGLVLPGATLTLTNLETGFARSDVSDAQGHFRAVALPPEVV